MKNISLNKPLLAAVSLVPAIALNFGCGKNDSSSKGGTDGKSTTANEFITNAPAIADSQAGAAAAQTNVTAPVAPTSEITNPPAAVTNTPTAPAAPESATAPVTNAVESASALSAAASTKVVEMPSTPAAAPKIFYPQELSTNRYSLLDEQADYHFSVRAGYLHSGYGNDRDTFYGGLKFYAHPTELRANAGKLGLLVPDATVEISHQPLRRRDDADQPGVGNGVQLRADFYWTWVNWTTKVFARENCSCSFAKPMTITFGPVATLGFDKTFEGSGFRFARYGGARLAVNRYAFLEYTWGRTDGIGTWSQQFLGEIPFYVSNDEQVRYVLRGEWMRGSRSEPDFYQVGAFVEMPLGLVLRPREWHSLVPFTK